MRTIRVKGRHLPWITSELLSLFKQRDKAWSKYRCSKDPDDWEFYRSLRNLCKTKTRNAKSNYFRDNLSHNFHNPKQFWNQLNLILSKNNNSSINQIRFKNQIISDPSLISQTFNQHFSSICGSHFNNSHNTAHSHNPVLTNSSFSFTKILPIDVFHAIHDLKQFSSAGPDGLDAKFLIISADVLMYPLADLFNLSLSTCSIPSIWKCARVTPLFKAGDPTDMNNYRPISIICSVAKIFEKLVFNQLSQYLNLFNILSPFQSGFRPKHSTTTALLKFTNDVFSSFDKGQLTGAIFIDLSKAFDMVDHYLLLDKLYSIGLSQHALLWFSTYLHNRRQSVAFQGFQSDFLIVENGVPQGSTLGPLLFSIFINDLPSILSQCSVHLYADDTVIYFSHTDLSHIQNSLQSDFNLVQKWFSNNKLVLNMKKSCCMLFHTSHSHSHPHNLDIHYEDGSSLETVNSFKYLGLWLDPQLSFKIHIDSVVKKTLSCLCQLYRSVNCFTLNVRKRIITQLILPFIDYANIVYQNTFDTYLKPLNIVYNSLCRFILRCPFKTHHCFMYESLNWLHLNNRRRVHWLLFIFNCIHSHCPSYLSQLLVPFSSSYSLRHLQHPFFFVPRISKVIGSRSFQYKAPYDWNNLPLHLRSITSFHCFRFSLFSHMKTTCSCF